MGGEEGGKQKKNIFASLAGPTLGGAVNFFFALWLMDFTQCVGVFEMGFPCFWRKSTFPNRKSSDVLFEVEFNPLPKVIGLETNI